MNGSRQPTWKIAGLVAGGLAGLAVLFFFPPGQYGFYPRCPLHAMTGLHCPGCGSLRAMHRLLHGDLAGAVHSNALLILSLPLLAWLGVNSIRRAFGPPAPSVGPRPVWLWLFFALMVAFGVMRNLPFAPFAHLAP